MGDLDHKIVRGSAWLALSYGGAQVTSFATTAVLARFVAPSAFGVVALASLVIVAMTTIQQSGLGLALIYKRDDVERAAAATLVFSVVMSVLLYVAAFAAAPLVAWIFREPALTEVLRVLTLVLIPRGLAAAPSALIEREMAFRARAKGELAGVAAQAFTAVPLAVGGGGVWSLVAGQLAGATVTAAVSWVTAPFRPSPSRFSWGVLLDLARYGRPVTLSNIVAFVDENVATAVIGRVLTTADVGYYNLAWRLSNLPATGIGYIVGRVMFPAYATLQADKAAFRVVFLTNVRRVALFSLPTGVVLLLAAHPIVTGVFGPVWQPAAPALMILAVFGTIRAFSATTGAVFQASGRPGIVGWLILCRMPVVLAGLVSLTPWLDVEGAALAVTLGAAVSLVLAYRHALRVLDLRLRDLVLDLRRPLACSLPLALVVGLLPLALSGVSSGLRLLSLLTTGMLVYTTSLLLVARRELKVIAAALRSS